ncbi:hypothetical protein PG993_012426 [Apiospora rasikravindrae]|uniref:Uncharacterized protein n=1 Tax=Apiospora rasikravindrae TaxID=990691 RepID=A0ABR1S2E0_9PEZI
MPSNVDDDATCTDALALSFHIPDMIAHDDRIAQSGEDINSLLTEYPAPLVLGKTVSAATRSLSATRTKSQYDKSVQPASWKPTIRPGRRGDGGDEGPGNLTIPDFMLSKRDGGPNKGRGDGKQPSPHHKAYQGIAEYTQPSPPLKARLA